MVDEESWKADPSKSSLWSISMDRFNFGSAFLPYSLGSTALSNICDSDGNSMGLGTSEHSAEQDLPRDAEASSARINANHRSDKEIYLIFGFARSKSLLD